MTKRSKGNDWRGRTCMASKMQEQHLHKKLEKNLRNEQGTPREN
jgi:hypothetical protein